MLKCAGRSVRSGESMGCVQPRVVVVGGGILGAAVTYHLARHGAHVTLLEAAQTTATQATGKSWAWLNANMKHPKHYKELNVQGMDEWRQYPGLASFCGTLILEDTRTELPSDYPVQRVPLADLHHLEPNLSQEISSPNIVMFPSEGWVDPVRATAFFVEEAVRQGAQVLCGTEVQDFHRAGQQVSGVVSSQGVVCEAEVVVLTAGTGIPQLAARLGSRVPLLDKPAVVVLTTPLPPLLQHMVISNGVFLLQRDDGWLLLGETRPTPDSTRDTSLENANSILQRAACVLPPLKDASVDQVLIGYRPYPADGHPILGWLSREAGGDGGGFRGCVYVGVTHSGMTLGPLLGRLIAQEVLDGPVEQLQYYRPDRDFSAADKAYG